MPGNPVFGPISNEELSNEDKKKSFEEVNRIKEQQHGQIKWITFANGTLEKSYLKEDETVYYQTCSTEYLISTLFIDTTEQHDVTVLMYQELTLRL